MPECRCCCFVSKAVLVLCMLARKCCSTKHHCQLSTATTASMPGTLPYSTFSDTANEDRTTYYVLQYLSYYRSSPMNSDGGTTNLRLGVGAKAKRQIVGSSRVVAHGTMPGCQATCWVCNVEGDSTIGDRTCEKRSLSTGRRPILKT